MDVILDSNVYLSDLKFQGTQFQELFAHLRRTGSTLIVPDLVLQETLERYKERLQSASDKAKNSWAGFVAIKMSEATIQFPSVDFDKELREYKSRLLGPATNVNASHYTETGRIDVNEIARRGTKRIPPANKKGEELRDVFLWLLAFQYARETGKQVAFISGDSVFRKSEDEDDLHPSLETEIANSKLPIHFYRYIATFVTSQALSQKQIDSKWFSKYIESAELERKIAVAITATETTFGYASEAPVPKSEFVEGMAYQVSADSVYAEVRFQGNTKLVFPLQSRAMHFRPHDFIMGYEFGGTLEASAFYGEMPIADVVVANPPFARFELSFKYEALVSARIDKGQLVSWHVDEVRLTGVRE